MGRNNINNNSNKNNGAKNNKSKNKKKKGKHSTSTSSSKGIGSSSDNNTTLSSLSKPLPQPAEEGFLYVDPARVRFQHSRIRAHFSGCGRSVLETLESIRRKEMTPADLPPIQVLVGPPALVDDEQPKPKPQPTYFSLNNRRLWVLKRCREEGLLEDQNNLVKVRVRSPKSAAEAARYSIQNCALEAKIMSPMPKNNHNSKKNKNVDHSDDDDDDQEEQIAEQKECKQQEDRSLLSNNKHHQQQQQQQRLLIGEESSSTTSTNSIHENDNVDEESSSSDEEDDDEGLVLSCKNPFSALSF